MDSPYAIIRYMKKQNDNLKQFWVDGKRSRTPEYIAWVGMKDRCSNQKSGNYKYYGGRGIKVCDRWVDSFENFYEDMGKRPQGQYSFDRKDNDGDYEPSNCRWATKNEQMANRRRYASNKSGFKGVYFNKFFHKYVATIQFEGRRIALGRFEDKEEAALAYDCASIQVHNNEGGLNIL